MVFKKMAITAISFSIASAALARPQEPYSPETAVSYMKNWAYSRNSQYPDLSNPNGDCTNFVSQALKYAGWRNTATTNTTSDSLWWFQSKNSGGYSQTWSVAHAFFRHMNGGVNPPGTGASYEGWTKWSGSSVNLGDIIQVDWNGNNAIIGHTMMVTGFKRKSDGTVEPRVTYHSTDTKDLPWSDFLARVSKNYPNAKFYRFGPLNACQAPKAAYIF